MKRFFWFLALAVAVSFAFTRFSLDRRIDWSAVLEDPVSGQETILDFPLTRPVLLTFGGTQHLRLLMDTHGYEHKGVFELLVDGKVEILEQNAAPFERRSGCIGEEAATPCRFIMSVGGERRILIHALERDAVVRSISFQAETAKRTTQASGPFLIYGFGLLLLLGPVLVLLRRWNGVEETALAALGLGWLAIAGWTGVAVAAAFLLGGYAAIRWIARAPRQARPLTATLVTIVLGVVLVKFVTPLLEPAFADPGGLSLALPLGISYFAIRVIDLILTANAGTLKHFTLRDFAALMLMPHTLAAGPIMTYAEFRAGRRPSYSIVDFAAGAARMGVGVGKKMVADSYFLPIVATNMDIFLLQDWTSISISAAKMLVANTLYIYLDFSAYSDMAIGTARAAGRNVPENFNWPMFRSGIRDYWRHWHITLSQWVMRRVYFPAFMTTRSTGFSMVVSMLVIGLWHALNFPWVLWGLHHGAAMALEARFLSAPPVKRNAFVTAARALFSIAFVWVWVSLGHSFTMFASVDTALRAYYTAVAAPARLVADLF